MRRVLFTLLFVASAAWAQQINSAEYWIDTDPGAGNGHPLTVVPGSEPTFSGTVDASALPVGLHTIGTRFRDDRNYWSSSEVRLYYVLAGTFATDVTAGEYWLDSDPGAGNGSPFTVTPGPSPNIAVSLPFEALGIGLHTLGVRFKDDRNIWASSEVRLFYVLSNAVAVNVTAGEYWLDSDPGAGNGSPFTVTPGPSPNIAISLPFEALGIGLHTLGVRFKDDRNIWGSSEVRLFYVLGNTTAQVIEAAEYWLDTDPGAGNGTSIAVASGASPVVGVDLPFNALSVGLHQVGIRFKDDRDVWGPSEARLFYVVSPIQAAAGNTLIAAEYFLNYDPGPGAGVPIPLPTDGNWDSAFETITDSIEHIPGGKYWIAVRFEDERGVWGSTIVDTFTVLPLLTILPANPPVLNWQSDNSSMYYIHRATSTNGPYAMIDSTTQRTYTDTENPTAPASRFYQITQRIDGQFSAFRLPPEPNLPAERHNTKSTRRSTK